MHRSSYVTGHIRVSTSDESTKNDTSQLFLHSVRLQYHPLGNSMLPLPPKCDQGPVVVLQASSDVETHAASQGRAGELSDSCGRDFAPTYLAFTAYSASGSFEDRTVPRPLIRRELGDTLLIIDRVRRWSIALAVRWGDGEGCTRPRPVASIHVSVSCLRCLSTTGRHTCLRINTFSAIREWHWIALKKKCTELQPLIGEVTDVFYVGSINRLGGVRPSFLHRNELKLRDQWQKQNSSTQENCTVARQTQVTSGKESATSMS